MSNSNESPKSVENYIDNVPSFARPMIERLRKIIRKAAPHLEEAIRWSSPNYKGRELVCAFAAFQKNVALVFWRGADLDDPKGLLVHGQGRSAMRSAKFTSLDQIDEKMVRAWVLAAAKLDNGAAKPKEKPQKKPEPVVPAPLAAALAKNAKAREAFESMPPSHRREYCEWIAEAKQEATVQRRVEKTVEKLAAGEGLNDKYRK